MTKHRRVWIEGLGVDTIHPEDCQELQTICAECGCCEHCFHACDCRACLCHEIGPARAPRLRVLRDET